MRLFELGENTDWMTVCGFGFRSGFLSSQFSTPPHQNLQRDTAILWSTSPERQRASPSIPLDAKSDSRGDSEA